MNLNVRVWDGKKFHYPDCNENESNHFLQLGSKGCFFLHSAEGDYITSSKDGGEIHLCSGLTDNNLKYMFHYDIVKYSYNWDYDNEGMKKFSEKKNASIYYGIIDYENDEYSHFIINPKRMNLSNTIMLIEVIGNLKENPEMIKKYNLLK